MINPASSPASEIISFINRDHIVCVTIDADHVIVVTTTAGTQIRIPASESVISQFTDDLANSVQSNFVSIDSARRNGWTS
jgi:hypothetical protein